MYSETTKYILDIILSFILGIFLILFINFMIEKPITIFIYNNNHNHNHKTELNKKKCNKCCN
jgi:hypothetical protein